MLELDNTLNPRLSVIVLNAAPSSAAPNAIDLTASSFDAKDQTQTPTGAV
ncbi:MAG: hypothetical protein ABIG34_02390 [Candidatus Peregrinibacteria bacterium]